MGENKERNNNYNGDLMPLQYYDIGANVGRRWEIYKYAQPEIDVHTTAVNALKLRGDEAVLDAGCGNGHLLFKMRQSHYPGKLIGLDLHEDVFYPANLEVEPTSIKPIHFVIGSVESLPFKNESVDAAMAMFVLYHTADPELALDELHRILKPGGRLAVATSGKNNKLKHRKFEAAIAAYLDIEPPPIFASRFDSDIATTMLTQRFGPENIEHIIRQRNNIVVNDVESYQSYLDSLDSMKNAFDPIPSSHEWYAAIDNVVHPVIKRQLEDKGLFTDTVERDLFICNKQAT